MSHASAVFPGSPGLLGLLALVAALGACHAASDAPHAAEIAAIEQRPTFLAPGVVEGEVLSGWIAGFGDPALQELVREALATNADLEQAAARVDLFAALARRAGAELLPELDLALAAGRGDENVGLGEVTRLEGRFVASWEPDLWGRLSAEKRASELDLEAAREDYLFARHALAAQTARAWFLLAAAYMRQGIDAQSLEQRERVERITRARYDAGEATPLDVDVTVGQSANARQLLELSRGLTSVAVLGLETLLGRYPSGELADEPLLPEISAPPPVGLPSELLERRPDVEAAQRALAATFARVDEAEAARLPRLALTASGGRASDDLHDLLDPSNAIWNLGANLFAPLLDAGRRQADVEAARALRRAALAQYIAVARRAFFEVEGALTAEDALRRRAHELDEAVDRLARARASGEERYFQGETQLLDLDQIHIQLYQAQRDLVETRLALALQRVDLHLALGGSFE